MTKKTGNKIINTIFPRVVPVGTIDFNYWIDEISI